MMALLALIPTPLYAGSLRAAPPTHGDRLSFNRDIRPILSNHCVACHGPDEQERKAKLRLDTRAGATADLGGYAALVPGNPESSELWTRLITEDEEERMPPKSKGAALKPDEKEKIRRWISQGAEYDTHWAYAHPRKVALPEVTNRAWPIHEVDRFVLARIEKGEWRPSPEADRQTLARRVALDLTGLPPSWDDVQRFVRDESPGAFERFVDRLLASPTFGEHWATGWLDLARYADSSGYPSDEPRQIWGYRDWVIRAFNRNLPFDQFTIHQLAGDLLPSPEEDQLIATAFHRNTMTQNEGGTSDEEFRMAAVVDRVNTTMAVWMGTTMACAQCHSHKYDPITQKDYYRFLAILNQSADADRKDEAPVHPFFSEEQVLRRAAIERELKELEQRFTRPPASMESSRLAWEAGLPLLPNWDRPRMAVSTVAAGSTEVQLANLEADGRVFLPTSPGPEVTTVVRVPVQSPVGAIRIEALADSRLPGHGPGHAGGNLVISRVQAEVIPSNPNPVVARRIRFEAAPRPGEALALAEVQVYSDGVNIAGRGRASQDSDGSAAQAAKLATDGNVDGNALVSKTVSVTGTGPGARWWQLELDRSYPLDRVVIWRRTDKGPGFVWSGGTLTLFDEADHVIAKQEIASTAEFREEISFSGRKGVIFTTALADATQNGFQASDVLGEQINPGKGWALAGHVGKDHELMLIPAAPLQLEEGAALEIRLDQHSQWAGHTLGAFRIAVMAHGGMGAWAALPIDVREALSIPQPSRTEVQMTRIRNFFAREVSSEFQSERARIAALNQEMATLKPYSVPVMAELPVKSRRVTQIQIRGNWQNLGEEVLPGVPEAFPQLPSGVTPDRLALARWLVDPRNPLTARVVVNRVWESIFGVGIVRTSEEFGSQGEQPSHPELLDWLAVDLMEHGWDLKRLIKQLVTSRTYRQDSRSAPELVAEDPENRLLARGPRFRAAGELLRDQALSVSCLLNPKMGGASVRPSAPNLGLSTAFGRSNDWVTSLGDDRFRRAVYTEVRRNSPYPGFATFDAPNREVCTIRRNRTNTPLQAFVTLNDPVFVEAGQALARVVIAAPIPPDSGARIRFAFRRCLSRDPKAHEVETLSRLLATGIREFQSRPDDALKLATEPLGPVPAGADTVELAAWTVVANVILNLDEFLMRR